MLYIINHLYYNLYYKYTTILNIHIIIIYKYDIYNVDYIIMIYLRISYKLYKNIYLSKINHPYTIYLYSKFSSAYKFNVNLSTNIKNNFYICG